MKHCIICGSDDLGSFVLKKGVKDYRTDYYLNTPFKIGDKQFYRRVCCNCFLKKYGRLPKMPNVLNKDMIYLFNMSESDYYSKRKTLLVTKENLINRHGEEEGNRKWNDYCERQRYTNTLEFKSKKYNFTIEEFKKYNKNRATTKENLINRHGEEEGNRKWNDYCERQRYTTSLDYFIEKYGEEEGEKLYINFSNKRISSERHFCRYSKISNELFKRLYDEYKLDFKGIYFGKNEYYIKYNNKRNKYYYDFVISDIKFCLEFHGDLFHPNIQTLKENFNEWKQRFTNKTAEEVLKKDKHKESIITEHGFIYVEVWESEYKKDKYKTFLEIKNKIEELKNIYF